MENHTIISSSFRVCLTLSLILLVVVNEGFSNTPAIDATADSLEFDQENNLLVGKGNVKVIHHGTMITADEIVVNTMTKDIDARGNVNIMYDDILVGGDEITGNLETKNFKTGPYRSRREPWFLTGVNGTIRPDGTIIGAGVALSTCDYLFDDRPHWRLECRRLLYYPDGRFTAHNVFYKVADIPVFYVPVIWGNTEQEIGNLHLTAGYKDDFGAIIGIEKEWRLGDHATTEVGLTWRTKRGLSVDNKTTVSTANSNTVISAFGMADREPLSDTVVNGKEFNGRFESEDDRYRLQVNHRSELHDRLTLRIEADHFSDNDLLFEFFRKDFYTDPQPVSFADLNYVGDFFEVSANFRPQLNDFESIVERLPELRLAVPRQPIFNSGLLLKSESTAAVLRMNWREYDLARSNNLLDPGDYATERIDTLNFLYYPMRVRALNLIPRIGSRLTYYSRSSRRDINQKQLNSNFNADEARSTVNNSISVFDYDDDGGDRFRYAAELGLEISWKLSREWDDVNRETWQIDGFRHILQPFANHTFIPEPNIDKENLFFFDDVDRIDSVQFTRFGLKHVFQTRRNNQTYTLGRMENFYDFYYTPGDEQNRPGDLGTTFSLTPNDRFSLWSRLLIDSDSGDFNVINFGAAWGRPDRLRVSVQYLYRDTFTSRFNYSMDSGLTQILSNSFMSTDFDRTHNAHINVKTPLNQNTALDCRLFFDLESGGVGRQSYEIVRDYHCWIGGFRLEKDENDIAFYVLFYLKAFPKLTVDLGF